MGRELNREDRLLLKGHAPGPALADFLYHRQRAEYEGLLPLIVEEMTQSLMPAERDLGDLLACSSIESRFWMLVVRGFDQSHGTSALREALVMCKGHAPSTVSDPPARPSDLARIFNEAVAIEHAVRNLTLRIVLHLGVAEAVATLERQPKDTKRQFRDAVLGLASKINVESACRDWSSETLLSASERLLRVKAFLRENRESGAGAFWELAEAGSFLAAGSSEVVAAAALDWLEAWKSNNLTSADHEQLQLAIHAGRKVVSAALRQLALLKGITQHHPESFQL